MSQQVRRMSPQVRRVALVSLVCLALVPLDAATVSRQNADTFARKIALIREHGTSGARTVGERRTPLSEDELNSWFAYHASPFLPTGLMDPQITIVGQGQVSGQAVVDFDAIARQRASGSTLDPWSYVGGKVPVTVTGILHTRDGMGRFELRTAEISGVPVPQTLLQEMLTYYSRSSERPQGLRLDDPFALPSNIRQIEVGQGQAVVVQ